MTRAELLLGLLRIAHHPAQGDNTTLEIAERWLARFDDLGLTEKAEPPKREKPAK